ncbi:probable inactive histone-lysine N-methyltransferase SUVR2, partial [Durio zibethinus]|uniref:Probable inactive histone-lysine N-methyltransferase SUVR2 n=1 Tax=Durio zibethinus TaxID=66656 RepID=A0A6P6AB89_DURZI
MAASEERMARACAAMESLYGTPAKAVRNAVKQLLKVYNNKWDFIEDNNYNVVFEYVQEDIKDQEDKNAKLKRIESDDEIDILGLRNYGTSGSKAKGLNNLQIQVYDQNVKVKDQVIELCSDDDEGPDIPPKRGWREIKEESVQPYPCKRPKTSNSGTAKDKEKEADDLQIQVYDQSGKFRNNIESWFRSDDEQEEVPMKRNETRNLTQRRALLTDIVSSKNELTLYEEDQRQPFLESISSDNETPIAVNHQDCPETLPGFVSSSGKNTNSKLEGSILESKILDLRGECSHNSETSQFDIVSSDNGAVKISLLYNSSRKANLDRPNLKAVTKRVENKYRKFYGITDPDFSVMKLMEDICKCFSEIAGGNKGGSERVTQISSTYNNSGGQDNVNTKDACQDSSSMQPSHTNESALTSNTFDKETQISQVVTLDVPSHVNGCIDRHTRNFCFVTEMETKVIINKASNSSRLKAVMKHRNHLSDITRGEENVQIPLLNDNGAKELPKFFYISKNVAFKDAYVTFSLARISDENCCSQCIGDCLSSELPCACAGETRGEFAYTPGGLVKETFLDEAITMSQKPKKHHFYYCQYCPLENNTLEKYKRKRSCKGHLMRKFIKECWNKCGCNKKCGNRVVQRGITATLQVFSTPEGKGWGLRSVHALKKGTFVCEYVGEIVTNQELHLRNKKRSGKEEHTYPVLLDADWGSERVLKDEEALCLDATKYGNCARFINHRCVDANLVEIPVEIETPDHHYYHLAFFTTRNVEPMEELTWDYGIQFDDKNHPIRAFNCTCGSKFCRDQEKSSRARA